MFNLINKRIIYSARRKRTSAGPNDVDNERQVRTSELAALPNPLQASD